MVYLLLLSLFACDLDPRPDCTYSVEVDPVEGVVEIVENDMVLCEPSNEALPDGVSFEALDAGDQTVTRDDLEILCSTGDFYTVLHVEDLPTSQVDLFAEVQPGTVIYSDLSRAVEGTWMQVVFTQKNDDGSSTALESWQRFFQLGGEDVVSYQECRDTW